MDEQALRPFQSRERGSRRPCGARVSGKGSWEAEVVGHLRGRTLWVALKQHLQSGARGSGGNWDRRDSVRFDPAVDHPEVPPGETAVPKLSTPVVRQHRLSDGQPQKGRSEKEKYDLLAKMIISS